jgi:hypothetical protein
MLESVIAAIDTANGADPNLEADDSGAMRPATLLYGLRMTAELAELAPEASDVLQIAARGQHIERWKVTRDSYPEGRTGYLTWRRDQGRSHGERLAGLMRDAGYPEDACDRVAVLLRKEGLKRDADVQMLEDTICMVFLQYYFAPFAAKHPEEKVLDIVAKTARKMSAGARALALSRFALTEDLASCFRDA